MALAAADSAEAQGCGFQHERPAGGRIGSAPLALGDSVMLGAADGLARAGFEVDARCARNPRDGIDVLRQRRRRGTLPEIIVMALGTNIWVSRADIRRMLRAVGRRRQLMLVTPYREWRPFHTGAMRRMARRKPRRVTLVDWSTRAERNRHWIWSDGTHLRPAGVTAYTRILRRAAWSRQRARIVRR